MITIHDLRAWKADGTRWVMLTAYDFPTAKILDRAGVPVLLVGDSVGRGDLGLPRRGSRRPGRVVAAQLHDRERPEPDEQHVEPRPGEQPHEPSRLARAGAVTHPPDPQRRCHDDDGREQGHRPDGPPQGCRRHGGLHPLRTELETG